MSETWQHLLSFENQAFAEAMAEHLRNKGVPTQVEVVSPVPGLIEDVRILVSSDLAHRARRIISSDKVSDSELEYAATGKLSPDDRDGV